MGTLPSAFQRENPLPFPSLFQCVPGPYVGIDDQDAVVWPDAEFLRYRLHSQTFLYYSLVSLFTNSFRPLRHPMIDYIHLLK
jgi:hypothetical protein